jgi:hypothetical protein
MHDAPRKSAGTENTGRKSTAVFTRLHKHKHTPTVVVTTILLLTIVVVAGCESFLYSCCKPPAVGRRQADPLEKRAQDWIHQEPECGISRNHACDVTSAEFFYLFFNRAIITMDSVILVFFQNTV